MVKCHPDLEKDIDFMNGDMKSAEYKLKTDTVLRNRTHFVAIMHKDTCWLGNLI